MLLTGAMVHAQDATATLLVSLRADEAERRIAALGELARGAVKAPILEAVALALGDPAREVRDAAVEALLALREDLRVLRPKLREIVTRREGDQWNLAQWNSAVGLGGRLANPRRYLAGLGDEDAGVRRKAVVALCALGSAAAANEGEILALLQDPDADVRAAVAKNVGAIGWQDTIRHAVTSALRDSAAVVRHGAAETLTQHSKDPEVVDALRRAVQDPDVDVRAQVLRGLGRSGKAGAAAVADIVASLRDREAKVRVAALEAVHAQELRSERAIRDSIRSLDEDDGKVLLAALPTVEAMGQAAGAAVPRIMMLTRHGHGEVRRQALMAAWAVAADGQRGAIVLRSVEALLDADQVVQGAAGHLLAYFVDRPH